MIRWTGYCRKCATENSLVILWFLFDILLNFERYNLETNRLIFTRFTGMIEDKICAIIKLCVDDVTFGMRFEDFMNF